MQGTLIKPRFLASSVPAQPPFTSLSLTGTKTMSFTISQCNYLRGNELCIGSQERVQYPLENLYTKEVAPRQRLSIYTFRELKRRLGAVQAFMVHVPVLKRTRRCADESPCSGHDFKITGEISWQTVARPEERGPAKKISSLDLIGMRPSRSKMLIGWWTVNFSWDFCVCLFALRTRRASWFKKWFRRPGLNCETNFGANIYRMRGRQRIEKVAFTLTLIRFWLKLFKLVDLTSA